MSRQIVFGVLFGLSLSSSAHAHGLSWKIFWLFAGAPVAAVILSVFLGVVARSLKLFLISFGLVLLWILWFWIAGQTTTLDIMFWIPMVGAHVQAAGLLVWLVYLFFKRKRR